MTAAHAPQTPTLRISAMFWGMLLIRMLLREMPSSSTVLVKLAVQPWQQATCYADWFFFEYLRRYVCQSNIFCVDDSGWWGRGGLFTALEVRSDEPRKQYELAGKMKGKINHDDKENEHSLC